jgi:aldose 1-epimerase
MRKPYLLKNNSVEFVLDPELGSQWKSLRFKILNENQTEKSSLEWVDVISGFSRSDSFFSSGSFIMFPWVNRMLPNSFYPNSLDKKDTTPNRYQLDSNNLPLHGTIHQDSWEKLEGQNQLELTYQEFTGRRKCRLTQDFELGEKEIKIHLQIDNLFPKSWHFSVGYHPYFRLPIGSVDDWILQFYGEGEKIDLDKNCLPILKQKGSEEIIASSHNSFPKTQIPLEAVQMDDLYYFVDGISISLTHPQLNYSICIESKGNYDSIFNYCQIYIPPSRDRIAIEPMLTPGNFENLPLKFFNFLEPNGKKNTVFCIKIKSK